MESEDARVILAITGDQPTVPPGLHPLAHEWQDIAERELRLGIPPGMPILVPMSRVDDRLNMYFRHGFPRDRMSTAKTYAVELRVWLVFLESRNVWWDEASREDVRSFQLWRVYDDRNPRRVTPATWNKGWAALRHFYSWAVREGWVERDPVGSQDRLKNPLVTGGHREKNGRSSRDRWLTPTEYAMWRDVGFRGYSAAKDDRGRVVATLANEASRARNTSRNRAFTDYLLATGLREEEAGSLLEVEIPDGVGEKTPIVGKGGVFRHYEVLHWSGLASLQEYLDGERRDAIRRAQDLGRYDRVRDRLVIGEVLPRGKRWQELRLEDGRVVNTPMLSVRDRRRLFVRGNDGLEPAALWLTEGGEPMPHTSWNAVFRSANGRVSLARTQLHLRSGTVNVTPHSLRFTFALMVLVAGVRAIDEALGLGPSDPFNARNYSHVFDEVKDLLGHAEVGTTKRTYLEPVRALRRSTIFRGTTVSEVWDEITSASALVGFGSGS